jgi:hypothetical protein
MIHIKRFIDKIAYLDSKNLKDVVLNIQDARSLRDEISKLLLDLNELQNNKITETQEVINIEVKGIGFK